MQSHPVAPRRRSSTSFHGEFRRLENGLAASVRKAGAKVRRVREGVGPRQLSARRQRRVARPSHRQGPEQQHALELRGGLHQPARELSPHVRSWRRLSAREVGPSALVHPQPSSRLHRRVHSQCSELLAEILAMNRSNASRRSYRNSDTTHVIGFAFSPRTWRSSMSSAST